MSVITFRPIGRLGNNMFQTAACIGYAKKYNSRWVVPVHRARGDNDPYLLGQFWPSLPFGDAYGGHRYEQHEPRDFNYRPIPHFPGGCMLVGFFQSEKWFEGAHDEVRAAFPLKHYPEYVDYVSIHVRRGDYVTNANSFPPITNEYVQAALMKIPYEEKRAVMVFSDDIEWCKNNLRFDDNDTVVFNEDANEFEALSKMASCSHHIIANSTFSWWGAWLGKNPNRIVVSPHYEDWFGNGFTGPKPKDLIPENWIQIKFR